MESRQRAYRLILEHGLVAVRNHAHGGGMELCRIEADHIHNIPSLLDETNEARHTCYILGERSLYLARLKALGAAEYLESMAIWYHEPWQALAFWAGVELSG